MIKVDYFSISLTVVSIFLFIDNSCISSDIND